MESRRRFTSSRVPPAGVFLLMDAAKAEARAAGVEIIDLSVGASDMAVPPEALETLKAAADDVTTHRYCLKSGTLPLLQACTDWYNRRYGVQFDPSSEALCLVGSQEGLAHLLLAVAEPGDGLLLTECSYPAYLGAAQVAGLRPLFMSLGPDMLPDFDRIPHADAAQAKVLLLNYPCNPTSAVADVAFFERALKFAEAHDLLLVHDNPYVGISIASCCADFMYDGSTPASPLALPGARQRVVELFSFAKSFHLGGFRLGFALGCREAMAALEAVKAPIDFNQYTGIQQMGITCLSLPPERIFAETQEWKQRAEAMVAALSDAGWQIDMPKAGMYLWARIPEIVPLDDVTFCRQLVLQSGVALSPGSGFGPGGKGFVRFALVQSVAVLQQCAAHIQGYLHSVQVPQDNRRIAA